jgi:NAD(P)-dependent dehydrogenase (short-subunit alcohol dehydrogenase family)
MSRRIALVTGASRGIGAAIARRLAADGMAVAVGYRQGAAAAAAVVAEITAAGGSAVAQAIDVADRDSIRAALTAIGEQLGPVDILVNNAAIAQEKPFLTISDDDWDGMLATNLRGPFACAQEVLPSMLERGWGRIVNIVSIGGQWGGINQIHYASAKAGLIGLTRSLAKTFSQQGITCNAVSPGLVATEMTAAELDTPAGRDKARQIPVGRIGTAEEIAAAVAYLVGPGGDYVSGQTLNVNGGMYFG